MAHDADAAQVVDVAFELSGERLPRSYRAALWQALVDRLSWLVQEPGVGVHPIRTPLTEQPELLVPRRARLTLRVPTGRVESVRALTGASLVIEGHPLRLGPAHVRPIEAFATIKAAFVVSDAPDEAGLHEDVARMLAACGMPLRFICGRRLSLPAGDAVLTGSSVVLHDLRAAQSVAMQRLGLGGLRHLGCGLFVPHKIITGLEDHD